MAGIYIWHSSEGKDSTVVNRIFNELGYKKGKHLYSGEWNAIVFPKYHYNKSNFLEIPNGFICGTGTFSYKGKVCEQALTIILDDILQQRLDLTGFWGNFLLFMAHGNIVLLIRDGAMISRLHKIKDKEVYSSSLVGLLRTHNGTCTLDKQAATELLSTGVLSDNSTLVKEIEFITFQSQPSRIQFLHSSITKRDNPINKHQALNQQIEQANEYIKRITTDWFSYMPESHLNVSITAGLDSRLLTALLLGNTNRFDFYTYWRDDDSTDADFRIAKLISNFLEVPLFYKKTSQAMDMSEERLQQLFIKAHNSCDGVIRPGTFWDEEFSTLEYRYSLARLPYLRVNAFEGEYFRNTEKIPLKSKRTYLSWIRWEMIYRFAGHNFVSKKAQSETEDRVMGNLIRQIGQGTFDLLKYKQYYRQIIVPSYRSLQTNMENKYGFIVSPFADTNLSLSSIQAYPFLGRSLQFELDMLSKISPKLADLPNDYGFNFLSGEGCINNLKVTAWRVLPPSIKHRIFSYYRNGYKSDYIPSLIEKSPFIKSLIQTVEEVQLPLRIHDIISRSIRGKLVLNLGFFLRHNNNWITW